jgi:hypothetical protein
MIKSIVVMSLYIPSTILGSLLVLPCTHLPSWVDWNLELRLAGDNHATKLLIGVL